MNTSKKRFHIELVALAIFFLLIRLPGLTLPYHQDEWKTAHAVETRSTAIAHPPLTQLSYSVAEKAVGVDNLRILPLIFSSLSLFLLAYIVRHYVGNKAALFAVFLYSISFYSVLASHMIDTDGALLPFFFLLSLVCYERWRQAEGERRWYWLIGFGASLLAGCMVKLSFVIVLGAFLCEYVLTVRSQFRRQELLKIIFVTISFAVSFLLILFVAPLLFPAFSLGAMLAHALSYIHLSGRNTTQVIVQAIKALEYLSPLLLIPLLLGTRAQFRVLRIFLIYLILGALFYFVLFDFSRGALDKYLMFSIIPLAAISGSILASLTPLSRNIKSTLLAGTLFSLAVFALNFFHQTVLPLYPKQEWFARVFHGDWDMLIPFTGGSGPIGFYVSFLFIAVVFLLSLFLALTARLRIFSVSSVVIILLILGVAYNAVFIEEYQWGNINGSPARVLRQTLLVVQSRSDISSVITYNDTGAHELSRMGKYANRFYAVPEYESVHKTRFSEFDGHFLIVDIPRIYGGSYYESFFRSCTVVFRTQSGHIMGTVYDCPKRSS